MSRAGAMSERAEHNGSDWYPIARAWADPTAIGDLDPDVLADPLAQAVARMLKGPWPREAIAKVLPDIGLRVAPFDPDAKPVFGATWADMEGILGPLSWQWQAWLPTGMLTLIAGQSEMGKSILALRIAACYLCGEPWPDGTPFEGQQGDVLWCEAESGQALNLDRAKRWGLPLARIHTPIADALADVILEDPEHRAAILAQATQPHIRLIVVDSLSGGNAKRDENSAEMLSVVKWLADLAKVTSRPVVLTHHLNKSLGVDKIGGISLDRVRGSSAIVQTPRVVWGLDRPDPIDKDGIRLAVIKSNLARKPEPLGMTIGDGGATFDSEAPEAPKTETQSDKAADILLAMLRKEPLRTTEIQERLSAHDISMRTAKRAKARLGIVSVRQHDDETGKDCWLRSLPAKQEVPL